jgi:hypothetical protein
MSMANAHEDDLFEEFGRYKLVARFHTGTHRGWLWCDGKRLAEVEANSNGEAMELLEVAFYNLLMDKAQQNGSASHSDVATERALLAIWTHLSASQVAMLRAHYSAPGRALTATQLAKAAKYKGYSGVNLHYGRVGWMMFGELPRVLPIDRDSNRPIYTFAIADGPAKPLARGEEWVWTLRPEVARGLELAALV